MPISYQWKAKPQLSVTGGALWIGAGCAKRAAGIAIGACCESTHPASVPIWLSTSKEQVIAVTGRRGSGKSFTLGVLVEGLGIIQDERASSLAVGPQNRAALLFDPLDLYWTLSHAVAESTNADLKDQFNAVRSQGYSQLRCNAEVWVPGGRKTEKLDPLTYRSLTIRVSQLEPDDWRLVLGGVSQLDPIGQALSEAIDIAIGRCGQRYDVQSLIIATESPRIEPLFQRETLRALRQRLTALDRTGLFTADGTALTDLLRPGQVSVVLLNRLSQENRELIVSVISRMLLADRQASAAIEKRLAFDGTLDNDSRTQLAGLLAEYPPKTHLVIDEAHGFLSPTSAKSTRNVFTQIVKEGRNCGLSVAMATQQPSAIDRDILSQVEVFISHQLTTESDIRSVTDNMKAPPPTDVQFGTAHLDLADIMRSLPPGYCIVSAADMSDNPKRTFLVQIRPRFTVHGGIEV